MDTSTKNPTDQYKELLRKANMVERKDPKKCISLLYSCLELIDNPDLTDSIISTHRQIVVNRIAFLQKKFQPETQTILTESESAPSDDRASAKQ